MSNVARKPAERARGERLETRTTAEKALIQHAAELGGRTVTDCVIASVQDAARRTVEAHGTIVLGAVDSQVFVDALLDPPPVDARPEDSVRRYREIKGIQGPRLDLRSIKVKPLGADHDRSRFTCGVPALDRYLRKQVRQGARRRVAAPFVAMDATGDVRGFYMLLAASIQLVRDQVAGPHGECATLLDMEDLDDRDAARRRAIQQRLRAIQECGWVSFGPIGTVAKRLLRIDQDQGCIGRH